ncbi:hypothetical protein [Pedobacter sp. B4-66]|uniref:hypothetical protein n=1 Tax=Pedobacter sp. B4-66 TaxID=2817280 RepID=UPI001BD95270|nr:hypothetical protein [Pedobacter sp. B4-66]
MKNLLYLLSFFIVLSSCSKKHSKPDSVYQYNRATTELRQQITVYAVEEKASVIIEIKFAANREAKQAKVTGIELFSANNQIDKIANLELTSESLSTFYTYLFHTTSLKEGINSFAYTLQYEDGFLQKGSFNVYAIKDKKIGTWWDKISYTYLDTLHVLGKMVTPIKSISEVKGSASTSYHKKQPSLSLIDGLYGEVFALFDNDKKIQAIYVYNGTNRIESFINVTLIKDDLLKVYPDCSVTESSDKSSYILKNSAFTFRVYKSGEDYFTEVKKTP